MPHLVLQVLFYGVYAGGAILLGRFVLGLMVRRVPARRLLPLVTAGAFSPTDSRAHC